MHARNIAIAVGLASALSLVAVSATAKILTAQDFVTKASIANKFEIDSSNLALNKSSSDNVKTFAQQMVDDHTKTGDKLKTVLKSSDSKAQPADALDDKHQKLLDKLTAAPGDTFDAQYISIQTDTHKEAVSLFSDYASNGTDTSLKNFAADTLPTLKAHLQHVEKLKSNP
jgi:putative membrane protein